ncbi:MAG: MaoC family dehydratase [Chloroflexota bacterium]
MRYYEDFSVGEIVDLGEVSLTADDIIEFATRYDPQPMHVDPAAGATSIYGSLIASGWQTAACYMRLVVDRVLADTASIGSPGIDSLRWLKPVKPGDVLSGRFTVLETKTSRSRPDWGIVRSRGEMLNQNDDVVMQVEAANFFTRRHPQQ